MTRQIPYHSHLQENLDLVLQTNENGRRCSFVLRALIELPGPDEDRWLTVLSLLIEAGSEEKESPDAAALRLLR